MRNHTANLLVAALLLLAGCGERSDQPDVEVAPNMESLSLEKGYGEGLWAYKGAAQVPRQYTIRAASLYSIPHYDARMKEPKWADGSFLDLQYLWAVRQLRAAKYPHELWPGTNLVAINDVQQSESGVNAHRQFANWYKECRPTAVLVWHFWFNPNPGVRGELTDPANIAALMELAREHEARLWKREVGARIYPALPFVNRLGGSTYTPQVTWKPDASNGNHGLETVHEEGYKLHAALRTWAEGCGVLLPTTKKLPPGTELVDRDILPFWNYYVEVRRLDADSAVTVLKTYQKLGEIDIIDHTDGKIMSDPALGNVPLEDLGYYHHPQNDYVAHGFEVFKDKLGL